ncbi:MAG: glycosyltransferase [Bacteroidales bacterium]|nr:glycosyltransferase [Bacteroidales bacterium]MBD5208662.1 glycosyltransferase [Bacteroidales bacterium]
MGITAVIGTKNSARHLDRVLSRLKGFDEILICDLESTDNTREIARRHGCSVTIIPESAGRAEMVKAALHLAKSEWLLRLTPLDLIPEGLADYLHEFIKEPGNWRAVRIPRKNFVMHKWNRRKYPDFQLRFFHRDYMRWDNPQFDEPHINGDIWRIPFDRDDLALISIPVNLPTQIDEAARRAHIRKMPRRAPLIKVLWQPFTRFLNEYFLKEKFRFGAAGFITAVNASIERYHYLTLDHEEKMMKQFMNEFDSGYVKENDN